MGSFTFVAMLRAWRGARKARVAATHTQTQRNRRGAEQHMQRRPMESSETHSTRKATIPTTIISARSFARPLLVCASYRTSCKHACIHEKQQQQTARRKSNSDEPLHVPRRCHWAAIAVVPTALCTACTHSWCVLKGAGEMREKEADTAQSKAKAKAASFSTKKATEEEKNNRKKAEANSRRVLTVGPLSRWHGVYPMDAEQQFISLCWMAQLPPRLCLTVPHL